MTTIIDSNSSIFDIDITVSHIEIEDGSTIKIRLYELQVKSTCTIYELISIMLLKNDNNVSRYRVILVFCGKQLNDINVIDKLSNHGIKRDSVINMMMKYSMTDETSNSVQLIKKISVYDNSVKDVKSDKGCTSNVKNDKCKHQSLDDIPKQVDVPITK